MTFKPKSFAEAKASYRPLKSKGFNRRAPEGPNSAFPASLARPAEKQGISASEGKNGHRALKARGRRTLKTNPTEWDRVRARLKPAFEARGIMSCEFMYPGCWHDDTLGFAHSRKRTDPLFEMLEVALACSAVCHKKLDENMSHAEMYSEVMRVINERGGVIQPQGEIG